MTNKTKTVISSILCREIFRVLLSVHSKFNDNTTRICSFMLMGREGDWRPTYTTEKRQNDWVPFLLSLISFTLSTLEKSMSGKDCP